MVELPNLLVSRRSLDHLKEAFSAWERSLWPDGALYRLDPIELGTRDRRLTFVEASTDRIHQPWQRLLNVTYQTGAVRLDLQLTVDTTVLDSTLAQLASLLRRGL